MYFNFQNFSSNWSKVPEVESKIQPWAQLTGFLSSLVGIVSGVAKRYAQSYALVQQSQYDTQGNVSDVTSPERTTVPEDVLAQAVSNLKSLKVTMAQSSRPNDDDITVTGTVTGDLTQSVPKSFDMLWNGELVRITLTPNGGATSNKPLKLYLCGENKNLGYVSNNELSYPVAILDGKFVAQKLSGYTSLPGSSVAYIDLGRVPIIGSKEVHVLLYKFFEHTLDVDLGFCIGDIKTGSGYYKYATYVAPNSGVTNQQLVSPETLQDVHIPWYYPDTPIRKGGAPKMDNSVTANADQHLTVPSAMAEGQGTGTVKLGVADIYDQLMDMVPVDDFIESLE